MSEYGATDVLIHTDFAEVFDAHEGVFFLRRVFFVVEIVQEAGHGIGFDLGGGARAGVRRTAGCDRFHMNTERGTGDPGMHQFTCLFDIEFIGVHAEGYETSRTESYFEVLVRMIIARRWGCEDFRLSVCLTVISWRSG